MYIFGDNDMRRGKRGQAVIRGSNNAMGIPTKKFPSLRDDSFYSDDEFVEQSDYIRTAVDRIISRCEKGEFSRLALPKDGLGTGLAQLNSRAPQVFAFLQLELDRLVRAVQALNFK